jgi:N-acetylmuramic acid 6-phosphate etherase
MTFRKDSTNLTQTARVGGWGPLLGDDGSGFDIGRAAIRHVLERCDGVHSQGSLGGDLDDFSLAILRHLGISGKSDVPQSLLSSILVEGTTCAKGDAKTRIAEVAKVVLQEHKHPVAAALIEKSVTAMTDLLSRVLKVSGSCAEETTLVMTGGLLKSVEYQQKLQEAIAAKDMAFAKVNIVLRPGLECARLLLETDQQ